MTNTTHTEPHPPLRAALYTRVSSDEQARGYSLTFQQEELIDLIHTEGATLQPTHLFVDDGYTGIHGDRPALQTLIAAARRREFDRLYVWKIDRLFRNTKLVLNLVDELAQDGVGVKSLLEPFCDSSTPLGRYMFTMLAAGAEMEHANINERTSHGKVRAMREGKWLCGTPTYGYDLDRETSKLVLNNEEARWVRQFFEWFVQERLTLYQLQQRVNALGLPTKHVNLGRPSKKTGKTFWNKRTLGRMVSNELYTGVFYYRKHQYPGRVHTETTLRPREEWIRIHPPAIVSEELYQQALRQLRINYEHSRRKTQRLYLFAKKLICGVCGHKINAAFRPPRTRTNQRGTRYYKGTWTLKHGTDQTCDNCRFYAEPRLDRAIWGGLTALFTHPTLVMERLDRYRGHHPGGQALAEEQARVAQQELEVAQKAQRLLTTYLDGDIDQALYKAKRAELAVQTEAIRARQRRVSQLLLSAEERTKRVHSLQALSARLNTVLETASYAQRCRIVDLVVEHVTLTGNHADVQLRLPLQDGVTPGGPATADAQVTAREPTSLWDKPLVVGPTNIFTLSLPVTLPVSPWGKGRTPPGILEPIHS